MGMYDKKIAKAQKMFRKLGSTVEVNGLNTIGLYSAIRSFQKKNGLAVTGELNKETWKLLRKKTCFLRKIF